MIVHAAELRWSQVTVLVGTNRSPTRFSACAFTISATAGASSPPGP